MFKITRNQILAWSLVLLLLGVPTLAMAYTIRGIVADTSGEPMIQASVRLLNRKDSVAVRGDVTDVDGRFLIKDVNSGNYILETSYVGYATSFSDVRVGSSNVRLDTIRLHENAIALREATVTGIQTPVKVMEDTIEYNAASYRTQPNAVVEDLLKRLPGVEVDSEGKITANGKEVTKILVDGKEFFSDDPKVASKNLPVDMVDKLQVVDRKSDLARLTGVDDGEDETVINLTVKKGMKNGWFGNIEGGYGTDNRYKGNFNVNRFWNDNQITFLGNFNNINELGFTDGTAGRFRRFGGDNGITTSQAFGVNFNVGNKEIFRVGGNVMYSHSDRDTRSSQDRQYLFADSTSFLKSQKTARDKGHNVNADFRMQWNPDSFNTLEFRPRMSVNISDALSDENSKTLAGDIARSLVTHSLNNRSSHGTSYEFGGRFIYNHKFRSRPGRAISFFANFNTSNIREKTYSYSWNQFFLLGDSIDLHDQFANDHTWSNNFSSRVSWTEPLGDPKKGNFLTVSYRFQYRWNNADKLTYEHPVMFPDGWAGEPVVSEELVLSDSLSNRFRNNYMNQDIRFGFKHVSAAHNIDVGVSLVPQMSKSINLINDAKSIPARNVFNVAPYMRYRYKMGKTSSLSIDYRGRSSQPSMTQLQPVADYSNPLNVIQGNPELNPTFTHNVRARLQKFNAEKQRSVMAMLDAQVQQNSIVSMTTFNPETGGQFTTYRNVNGQWNVRAMGMFSTPLRNRQFTFNNHMMLFYNNNIGFNNGMRNRSGSLMLGEMFAFAWRPDNAELELRPHYNLQYVNNSFQTSANRFVHTYGGTFTGTYNAPFGLGINTSLTYSATSGYSQGYDTRQWMWDATLSYQFLRDRSATVALTAYDLLGQKSNVRRNVTANYIDDTLTNSLTRYFMITLSYRFNTFGKGNQPANRNEGDFRRMGPPPGAGGPPPGRR